MTSSIRVLLVDDEPHSRQLLVEYLRGEDYIVDECADGNSAMDLVRQENGKYDLVLLDQVLGSPPDGIATMRTIKEMYPNSLVVIFTGFMDRESGMRALREGAYRYIAKPVEPEEISILIESVAERRALEQRLELTAREKEWLRSSLSFTNTLLKRPTRKQVLDEIERAVRAVTGADQCSIVLPNLRQEELDVFGAPRADWEQHFLDVKISRSIMENGTPVLVTDALNDSRVNPQVIQSGIFSFAGVPIRAERGNIGVLWAYGHKPRRVNENTLPFLQMLADQAAVGMEAADLFDKMDRRAQELNALINVSKSIGSTIELEQVLEEIREQSQRVLGISVFYVALYDEKKSLIEFPISYEDGKSNPIEARKFSRAKAEWGLTEYVLDKRETVLSNDLPLDNETGRIPVQPKRVGRESCSWLGIPLLEATRLIGVMSFQSHERDYFDDDKIRLASAIANLAELAIANAQHHEEIEGALKAIETVANSTGLGAVGDFLQTVVNELREAIDCDVVTLYSYDPKTGKLEKPRHVGLRFRELVWQKDFVEQGAPPAEILNSGKPYFADDASTDSLMQGKFQEREGVRSSAGLPLLVRNMKVGVLFVNYRMPHHFTDEDQRLLLTFASLAAVAIHNAQLFAKSEKQSVFQEMISAAGKAVTASVDRDQVLDQILSQASHLTSQVGNKIAANWATLQLLEGNDLVMVRTEPSSLLDDLKNTDIYRINLETGMMVDGRRRFGITGSAARTKSTRLVPDVYLDPDFLKYGDVTRSELAIPLLSGGQVIGVLNVEHPDIGTFEKYDQEALEALASYAVIAIQNAQRVEENRRTQQKLMASTAVAHMGIASSTWRHAIGTYATTIVDAVGLLRGDIAKKAPREQIEERLAFIEKKAKDIRETPITAPLSTEEGVESIRINQWLSERIPQLLKAFGAEDVRVEFEFKLQDTATVRASREWLRRALDNVVKNAVDAMASVARRRLMVATFTVGKNVEVHFTDVGGGIPVYIRPKVLEEQIPKSKGEHGSGIGLLQSRLIVQKYGGDIQIGKSDSTGTTMVIWLPLE